MHLFSHVIKIVYKMFKDVQLYETLYGDMIEIRIISKNILFKIGEIRMYLILYRLYDKIHFHFAYGSSRTKE